MSEYTEPIAFADIREGDELTATENGVGHTGTAHAFIGEEEYGGPGWITREGGALVSPHSTDIHRKPRPVPAYEPGVTGTATTEAITKHGMWAVDEDNGDHVFWFVDDYDHINYVRAEHVTSFTPDPPLLTPEVLENTRADERERLALLAEELHRIGEKLSMDLTDEEKQFYSAHRLSHETNTRHVNVAKWLRNAPAGAE